MGRLAVALITAVLAGCAPTIGPQAITPLGPSVVRQHEGTVAVEVYGGRPTGAGDLPQVSNEAFAEAIATAIHNGGVFRDVLPATAATYVLRVNIASLQQPIWGGAFTVKMETGWQLENVATRQVLWRKGILSSHTVTVGEAFVGATRVKLATEGAARDNVRQGVEWLSQLEL
jgi:hypothetical protein